MFVKKQKKMRDILNEGKNLENYFYRNKDKETQYFIKSLFIQEYLEQIIKLFR